MIAAPTRLVAAALVGAALVGLPSPRPARPSVLLIVIDTLRADHLGCYGYARPTSPHLDALARRGVRFANAHAPASWTGASVASILTGLYPAVHGVDTPTSVLSDGVPIFAYVHYLDPHADYFPPPAYAARFGVSMDAPLAGIAQRPLLRSFHAPASADDLATLIGLYDGEIAFTDDQVGRLIDEIRDRVAGPMLVVVTADHGEEFGDHGGLLHGITLWEEQLHVPLIVAGTRIAPGRTIRTPVSLVSVWPMLAGLTGVGTPMDTTERPAAAPLLDAAAPTPIFADLERPSPRLEHWHSRVVIDGSWKLIVASGDSTLVFDLAHDPGERRDVAAVEPERRVALAESLRVRDAAAVAARAGAHPGTSMMTAERRERLKALGYAQ
jgi:arylsulfatase A-like enzyme